MKSVPLNIFPTAISEFYVGEEPFFEELIETEKRIGDIPDELNLATVSNITSSYGCNQVRLKIIYQKMKLLPLTTNGVMICG